MTAVKLRNCPAANLLPLPVRNERGEGRGEGRLNADSHCQRKQKDPPHPSPLLPPREEREKGLRFCQVHWLHAAPFWRCDSPSKKLNSEVVGDQALKPIPKLHNDSRMRRAVSSEI